MHPNLSADPNEAARAWRALELLSVPIALLGADGRVERANAAFREFLGPAVGRPVWELPWPGGVGEGLARSVGRAGAGGSVDVPLGDGGEQVRLVTVSGPAGASGLLLEVIRSGAGSALHPRLVDLEARAEALGRAMHEGVMVQSRDLQVLSASPRAEEILGHSAGELLGRSPFGARWRALREDGSELPPDDYPAVRALATGTPHEVVAGVHRRGGELAWLSLRSVPLRRDGEREPYGVLTVLEDLTELRLQRERLQYQAGHDALTDLPNRDAFFAQLRHGSRSEPYAVMHVDLDGFQAVNDNHGHALADDLLTRVARRLERSIRPEDLAARIGGDEFAVLLRDVGEFDNAVAVARRVVQQLRAPFHLRGQMLSISASVGLAFGRRGEEPEEVVVSADYAVRHAKRSGKNRFEVFTDSLSRSREVEVGLEAELKGALERGELEVHFQPILDAKEHRLACVEALLRWRHPERGMIGPEHFVPVAERTGLIIPIGEWVIESTLAQLQRWRETLPALRLSLNLSPRQLESAEFAARFGELLRASGVPPEGVVLEVTESVAMQRIDENASLLRKLAKLGVTLAVDDFGTGYSSLSYLQHLPFSIVKIDRSFMRNVPDDRRNTALVRTIVAMAQALNLQVVAEGVETQTQAFFLYWEGADWVQGFHFGKPMPPEELQETFLSDPDAGSRAQPGQS